jgi:DNA repair exonuclease SbcCD ATPase subunit
MDKIDSFYNFINKPSTGDDLLNNFLDSNLTAYKMIYTAIDKDVMKKNFQEESNNINSYKKLSILLEEQLKELNIDQYKINICMNRLKTLIKAIFKEKEEKEEQEKREYRARREKDERERLEREREEMERKRREEIEQERREREEQERKDREDTEEQEEKKENVRQSKRSTRKRVPMTEEEKKERQKERRKERYYNEKEKMATDPKYAAYRDFRKGIYKPRSNDPEYVKKYDEEWTSHSNKRYESRYNDFFGYRPPPSPPRYNDFFGYRPQPPPAQRENEKEKEKEYQEELKANKDLLESDKFRCVAPYNKGDDNIRNRLNSCKNSGNYKKGYSKFFDNKQQCIEYCNM